MVRKILPVKKDFRKFRRDSVKFKNAWFYLVDKIKETFRCLFGLED